MGVAERYSSTMRRSIQVVTFACTLLLTGCPKNDPPKPETKATKEEAKSADEKKPKAGDDDDDDSKAEPKGSSAKKPKKDDDDDDDDKPVASASAKPSASLTATPGVKWDPNGYPGGFAAECDHKLNGVSHQPEDYDIGGSCEQKWAPSCEAVLKCIKRDKAFPP